MQIYQSMSPGYFSCYSTRLYVRSTEVIQLDRIEGYAIGGQAVERNPPQDNVGLA